MFMFKSLPTDKSRTQFIMLFIFCLGFFVKTGLACTPVLLQQISSTDPELNGDFTFECNVKTCSSGYTLEWKNLILNENGSEAAWLKLYYWNSDSDSGATETETNYNIIGRSSYIQFLDVHFLTVANLEIRDNGTWNCVVVNEQVQSNDYNVVIEVQPKLSDITIRPDIAYIVDGETSEFQCEVQMANPAPLVKWVINGNTDIEGISVNRIVNNHWSVTNTAAIEFPNVGNTNIKCSVGNASAEWTSKHTMVDVKEKAQIVDQASDGEIQVDESFSLTCEASGYIPLISWKKDGSIIKVDNPLYTITAEGTPKKQISTLTSLALDPPYTCDNVTTYGGSYRCVATLAEPYQDSTDISDNIDITILYSPISGPDHSQERGIGETDVVLTCEICGSKILSDKWLLNGNDAAERVLQDGSLSIERLTASSFGNYTRVVTNSLGTGICSVVLIHTNALDVVSGLSEAEIAGIIMGCLIVVTALSSSVLLAKRYQQNKQKGPKIPHIYENSTHESHDVTSQNATGLYELDENAPTKEVSNSKAEYSELNRTGLYDNAAVHVYEVLNK